MDECDLSQVRWASRVNPTVIRRLYETDARGLVDEDLINEVGFSLFARCQSILRATEAQNGRVTCPRCTRVIVRAGSSSLENKDEIVTCERCNWSVRWEQYFQSYQGKHLVVGGATAMH